MGLTGKKLIEGPPPCSAACAPLQKALKDSGISPEELEGRGAGGGSCKMPVVRQYLNHLLGSQLLDAGHPDTVVAQGAGLYAAMKAREENLRRWCSPISAPLRWEWECTTPRMRTTC